MRGSNACAHPDMAALDLRVCCLRLLSGCREGMAGPIPRRLCAFGATTPGSPRPPGTPALLRPCAPWANAAFSLVLPGGKNGTVLQTRMRLFWGGGGRVVLRRILRFVAPGMGIVVGIFKELIIHFSFAHN